MEKNELMKMSEKDRIQVPAMMIPSFRTQLAINRNVHKNLLFKTYGGIGDQICAEPTIRYAFRTFNGLDISLASEQPELFGHLPFKNVYDLNKEQPKWEDYFVFDTIFPPTHLQWEYMGHMIINAVDYVSLCSLRSQIPVADKELKIIPNDHCKNKIREILPDDAVLIHAGRHWPIKTFPKDWWDEVLHWVIKGNGLPVLMGADTDDNRGTVDIDTHGCLDFRNKLSIMESVAMTQKAHVIITNDSSPLHMAASGDAWIAFIATCKHPDFIMHWRHGQWAWRMQNFGIGGIWQVLDHCPNKENEVKVDQIEESLLRSWLPKPKEIASWALSKLDLEI